MGLMDKLKGELVDIIEWIDDSRSTLAWRFPALSERDQERCRADRPRGPGGRVRLPRRDRRQVHARALRAEVGEPADPVDAAGLEARLRQPVPLRGLLHQHPPGHRHPLGHAAAGHRPRSRLQDGAGPRQRPVRRQDRRHRDLPQGGHRHRLRGRSRRDHRTAASGHLDGLLRHGDGVGPRRHRSPGPAGVAVGPSSPSSSRSASTTSSASRSPR